MQIYFDEHVLITRNDSITTSLIIIIIIHIILHQFLVISDLSLLDMTHK